GERPGCHPQHPTRRQRPYQGPAQGEGNQRGRAASRRRAHPEDYRQEHSGGRRQLRRQRNRSVVHLASIKRHRCLMPKSNFAPIEQGSLPTHVAVIMDGNNRWARVRGESGSAGHRAGAEAAREIVFSCVRRNIKYLTLFAFSSENWLRPNKEVKGLMALFLAVLKRKEITQMHNKNVRLQFIGNRESFSPKLQQHMRD